MSGASASTAVGPLKIVILGEGRVGKTSLLRRYVRRTFDEREASTQCAAYLEKRLVLNGTHVQLSLWDTAGQERFHSLAPIYYRDAAGALLVYDVTDVESFRRVAKWVEELRAAGTCCPVAIVGNKADLRPQARVPQADAEAYAKSIGARHCTASARSGSGVDEAFELLAEAVFRSVSVSSRSGTAMAYSRPTSQRSRPPGMVLVVDDVPQGPRKRERCCGGEGRH